MVSLVINQLPCKVEHPWHSASKHVDELLVDWEEAGEVHPPVVGVVAGGGGALDVKLLVHPGPEGDPGRGDDGVMLPIHGEEVAGLHHADLGASSGHQLDLLDPMGEHGLGQP